MSTFLDNLIAKSLVPKAVIQPRSTSLYEPSCIIDGPENWNAANPNGISDNSSGLETERFHEPPPSNQLSENRSSRAHSVVRGMENNSNEIIGTEADLTPRPQLSIPEKPSLQTVERKVAPEPIIQSVSAKDHFSNIPIIDDADIECQPVSKRNSVPEESSIKELQTISKQSRVPVEPSQAEDQTTSVQTTAPTESPLKSTGLQPNNQVNIIGQKQEIPPVKPKVSPLRDTVADSKPTNTVQVTIGRIEVKAVNPPQPNQRPAPKRPSPTLTLEEYLKKRNGER